AAAGRTVPVLDDRLSVLVVHDATGCRKAKVAACLTAVDDGTVLGAAGDAAHARGNALVGRASGTMHFGRAVARGAGHVGREVPGLGPTRGIVGQRNRGEHGEGGGNNEGGAH
ncbi:MAG: hypothetical protein EBR45_11290, partial [Betaproteobacteria bacterium]|nr:hypothetical protein [Betaproteobacteria bacterium]